MRSKLILLGSVAVASAAHSQTTATTNCTGTGYSVQCTTRTQPGVDWNAYNQQMQANIDQSMANLGSAIAAARARHEQKKREEEIDAALASDDAYPTAPPTDEKPVLLTCHASQASWTVALYEKNGRADVTSGGLTRMRSATFTPDTVMWVSKLYRTSISRIDGSITSVGIIPAIAGLTLTGSCSVATARAF